MRLKTISLPGFYLVRCIIFLSCWTAILVWTSCHQASGGNTVENGRRIVHQREKTKVQVVDVKEGVFNMEIISNGKAYALLNSTVNFPLDENIKAIFIQNGDWVKAGQVLAVLDDTEVRKKFNRSRDAFERARVELDDRLIDYGYRLKDSSKVPVDILKMARIKSGYNAAVHDYADARNALDKIKVRSAIAGRIANLEARQLNNARDFKKLCTVIDDRKIQVEFSVLESEFHYISKGALVGVFLFGDEQTLSGRITQINPLIDENGMVKITALVDNEGHRLLNGMNVKVVVKHALEKMLYIPKEAVLERQDRQLVFTYVKGLAKWNYVQTGVQNNDFLSVMEGLKVGDKVIVTNNINLVHNSEISLEK